jgi:hypothetical protein
MNWWDQFNTLIALVKEKKAFLVILYFSLFLALMRKSDS